MMQLHITNCVNPRSRPKRLSTGANPHKPGFHRPHVKHRSSLTPTRLPQDGQTTEPHFCRSIVLYSRGLCALKVALNGPRVITAPGAGGEPGRRAPGRIDGDSN